MLIDTEWPGLTCSQVLIDTEWPGLTCSQVLIDTEWPGLTCSQVLIDMGEQLALNAAVQLCLHCNMAELTSELQCRPPCG